MHPNAPNAMIARLKYSLQDCNRLGKKQRVNSKCYNILVDVSDIFYFFLLGEGEGGMSPGRQERGGSVFYLKSQEGGGVSRGGSGRRPGRVELGKFFLGGGG